MKRKKGLVLGLSLIAGLAIQLAFIGPGWAQEGDVCNGVTCENLATEICTPGGLKITLTEYSPAALSPDGTAIYKYRICSPPYGTCEGTVSPGKRCLDNSTCQSDGQSADPNAYCNRECVVDTFSLGYFDVTIADLGKSCLSATAIVNGSCTCDGSSDFCQVGIFDLGYAYCFSEEYPDAMCPHINLAPGYCILMTVNITDQVNNFGLGPALVAEAAETTCIASCIAGPSCTHCEETPPGAEACLTRTRGFWARHPHIARMFDPVEVCGVTVEGTSPGKCSTSEALCSNEHDYKKNPPYLSLVAQLTAVKLNLNATAALTDDVGTCATWQYQDKSIQEWISYCEKWYCEAGKRAIIRSGCIEALAAFNKSQDTGFEVTPPPFDRPGPVDPRKCQAARGNGIFIGKCPEERPPDCHENRKKWHRHMPIRHPKDRWDDDCSRDP